MRLPDPLLDSLLDPWLDLVHGGACVVCGVPGRSLCRGCEAVLPTTARRVRPTPCPDGLARCFAAGEYDGPLGRLVVAHKERAAYRLASALGGALATGVAAAVPAGAAGLVVLVPVPSNAATVRARGHDPMLRIARAAARKVRRRGSRVEVVRLLEQRGPVRDQAGLGHAERAANLAYSMGARSGALARLAARDEPVSVVVCDDVLTTGATAREAQRALEDVGVAVCAIATVAATRRRVVRRHAGT